MPGEALEGTVTILFTDVEGSTDLGTRVGDVAARTALRTHEELVRARVTEHGGREIKSLGDGFMIAFSSARRAVTCAVDIQRAVTESRNASNDLRVRIGLNAGEAIHEEGDLFGSAVSAAARISDRAKGGEILISEVVKALVGRMPDISFKERGDQPLKGFDEPWRLFEVVWEEKGRPPTLARTPFVGREEERKLLRGLLDRLGEKKGAVAMIGGEPGVGKTRLAEEIAFEARQREFRALVGRCYEMDSPPPYLPFIQLLEGGVKEVDRETFRLALGDAAGEVAKVMPQLRHLYDDIPPPLELPPEQERRYLFNSIAEFVRRAGTNRPLVVLLDDLHWSDESSLLLLQHIVEQIESMSVLIIGTYRDAELDVSRPLANTLDTLVRRRLAHRVSLKRLGVDGVEAMLARLGGKPAPARLVDAIYEETDGNAFFVEEVFRHLTEEGRLFDQAGAWRDDLRIEDLDVPESVRLVIGRRVQRLSAPTKKALTAAAVIGKGFDYALLEALGEVTEDELLDAIDEAQNAGLVTNEESSTSAFDFVHELIRQALLAGIATPRRQRLHARIAEAMEALYADRLEERAGEIANHLARAGAMVEQAKTVRFLMMAGDRSLEAAAHDEALRFFEDALALTDEDRPSERAEILDKLGLAQRSLGRLDESIATWHRSLELYEKLGDAAAVGRVAPDIAIQLAWAGRWEDAVEIGLRGISNLGESDSVELGRLQALIGMALGAAGQYEQGMELVERGADIGRSLGDDGLAGEALVNRSIIHWGYGEFSKSVESASRGSQLARAVGDLWTLCNGLSFWGFALLFMGRFDEAFEIVDELEPLAMRVGHAGGQVFATRMRTTTFLAKGRLHEAERSARRDIEINEQGGLPWVAQAYGFLGGALIGQDRTDEALELFERSAKTDPPGITWGVGVASLLTAKTYLGHVDEARRLAKEIAAHLPHTGEKATVGQWMLLYFVVDAMLELGMREEVAALRPVTESADYEGIIGANGRLIETGRGVAAAAAKDWPAAEEHFETALAQARKLDLPADLADTQRFYAAMLLDRDETGDRERAFTMLESVVRMYDELDMPFFARLVERKLTDARKD